MLISIKARIAYRRQKINKHCVSTVEVGFNLTVGRRYLGKNIKPFGGQAVVLVLRRSELVPRHILSL